MKGDVPAQPVMRKEIGLRRCATTPGFPEGFFGNRRAFVLIDRVKHFSLPINEFVNLHTLSAGAYIWTYRIPFDIFPSKHRDGLMMITPRVGDAR